MQILDNLESGFSTGIGKAGNCRDRKLQYLCSRARGRCFLCQTLYCPTRYAIGDKEQITYRKSKIIKTKAALFDGGGGEWCDIFNLISDILYKPQIAGMSSMKWWKINVWQDLWKSQSRSNSVLFLCHHKYSSFLVLRYINVMSRVQIKLSEERQEWSQEKGSKASLIRSLCTLA